MPPEELPIFPGIRQYKSEPVKSRSRVSRTWETITTFSLKIAKTVSPPRIHFAEASYRCIWQTVLRSDIG
jgi:hypothetical protein